MNFCTLRERSCGQQSCGCANNCYFQKIASFHDLFPLSVPIISATITPLRWPLGCFVAGEAAIIVSVKLVEVLGRAVEFIS